ncbi:MAG: bifunctional folylpolyglutamate synthase/dihydrofolate synthase [Halothiobacillaceae bacterium]
MDPALSRWLERLEALDISRVELGLGRVDQVYRRLSPFASSRPTIITVAGTNGKGSTVAFLEAMLMAAGHRVTAYVSPHLNDFRERIRFDGQNIDSKRLVAALDCVEQARQGVPLTYFEYTTLAALQAAGAWSPAVLLLEVGLGGRLDAVNVVDADIAVITRIGIDHARWLGNDIESIAFEKAGILRAGRPAVFSGRSCPQAIIHWASVLGAPLYRLGSRFYAQCRAGRLQWTGPAPAGTPCASDEPDMPDSSSTQTGAGALSDRTVSLDLPLPALPGAHQIDNAAGAIMAALLLPSALRPDQAAVAEGLRSAANPGRGEIIERDGVITVLDVAHNPQGCAALRLLLEERIRPAGAVLAVMGALADKDPAAMAAELAGCVDAWFLGGLGGPRGLDSGELRDRLADVANVQNPLCDSDPVGAYNRALCRARPGDVILVFGSFMTVAAVRGHLIGGI